MQDQAESQERQGSKNCQRSTDGERHLPGMRDDGDALPIRERSRKVEKVATSLNFREVVHRIGQRQLFGRLAGEGDPPVIFDAGMGDTSENWKAIQAAVAKFTCTFSYDRAGLGRSDKAATPRTCRDIIADLKALLTAASLPAPYVLVAHSWSGINARWYASVYPAEIAGLVLVDAVHEDKYAQFTRSMPPEQAERMWASVKDPAKNDENIDRLASIAQLKAVERKWEFPLVVLTRNAADVEPGVAPDPLDVIETTLQREFLKLSSDSKQIIARHNDHFLNVSEPELVIDAIRQVVKIFK
jgi:pimeloyl-ACP methyl ester carboxylesterase